MVSSGRRGIKDILDVIQEAQDQGWIFKDAAGRNNNHSYLVPPSGGFPVPISSTPGTRGFRMYTIQEMRRQGFIWPPPPKIKIKKEETVMTEKVVLAARDQGWTVEDDGKEIVFVPPQTGGKRAPTIKIPNAKGCGFFDLQNLRRAGLIYPWTPPDRTEDPVREVAQETVTELWRSMDNDPDYEISNAGRGRRAETGKLLPVYGSGAGSFFKITNKGRAREKNIKALVVSHFGHPPMKNVALTDEVMVHRSSETKALLETPIEYQENDEVTVVLEDPTTRELEDGWAWIKSEPEVVDGYAVSVKGDIELNGQPRARSKIGALYWVQLRRFDNGNNKAVRLDKLVLRNFVGKEPFENAAPIHRDGDSFNCELDNLEWPTDTSMTGTRRSRPTKPVVETLSQKLIREKTEAQAEPAPPVEVPDEVTEVMEPEPKVDEFPEPPAEAREVLERMEQDLGFEPEEEDLDLPEDDEPDPAPALEELAKEPRRYEHQEYVDKVVAEAPSFTDPEKTVTEVQAEKAAEFAEAEAERAKPKRRYNKKQGGGRAKVKPAALKPTPARGVFTGRYWQDEETGLMFYVSDDGIPEFPAVTTPEEGKAAMRMAALAQEWIDIMGMK